MSKEIQRYQTIANVPAWAMIRVINAPSRRTGIENSLP